MYVLMNADKNIDVLWKNVSGDKYLDAFWYMAFFLLHKLWIVLSGHNKVKGTVD